MLAPYSDVIRVMDDTLRDRLGALLEKDEPPREKSNLREKVKQTLRIERKAMGGGKAPGRDRQPPPAASKPPDPDSRDD